MESRSREHGNANPAGAYFGAGGKRRKRGDSVAKPPESTGPAVF